MIVLSQKLIITLGRTSKSHTRRGIRGEGEGPPWVFVVLLYFEKVFPLVDTCDVLYKMGL